jgi:hypothetical protein
LFAFLVAVQLFQITSEATSTRTLRQAIAVTSEIDVLLDRHYDDLRQRAESSEPNDTLELQDYPLAVPLTADEVRTQSRHDLRETLLTRGAALVYDDGTEAMRNDASSADVGVFSFGGSIDRALNLLRQDVHRALGVMMVVLGALSLLLAAALLAVTRGFGRIVAPAAVGLASSMALLLVALIVRVGLTTSDSSEYVSAQFLDIAGEVAWLPVRNGAILVALFAFVAAIAAVTARTAGSDRRG